MGAQSVDTVRMNNGNKKTVVGVHCTPGKC